jgi:alginate O-acetyltransferase complex protein AlgI
MLFNSFEFLLFFPLVVILFYSLSHAWRERMLLIASLYFYMCWNPKYVLLLLTAIVIDYYAGIQMGKHSEKEKRRKFLYLSLFENLGFLFAFKYFNFFNDSIRTVFQLFDVSYKISDLNILLPVGISFYTFQSLTYTIDVYRGKIQPETNFIRFALFVSFFPQLVCGPIARAGRLIPQFYKKIVFDPDLVASGLKLMYWGFFKKLVIADRLASFNGSVFNDPLGSKGFTVMLASILLHIQVYSDLSGYTDIARGSARVLGYDLIKNFNMPLFTTSLRDFWRRWHISLTSWFMEYLYIPLGGSRVPKWRWYYNIFIVFLVSGLWHGAKWNFVIWGSLYGFLQLVELWVQGPWERFVARIGLTKFPNLYNILCILFTLCVIGFVTLFFGAKSLDDARTLISNAVQFATISTLTEPFHSTNLILGVIFILFLVVAELLHHKYNLVQFISKQPVLIRWPVYVCGLILLLAFGCFQEREFVYFQF